VPANAEFFIIKSAQQSGKGDQQSYLIRVRDSEGQWMTAPTSLSSTLDVRAFLDSKHVDEKRIALAVEELGRSGHVSVIGPLLKAA
jgi:hypothetical protein